MIGIAPLPLAGTSIWYPAAAKSLNKTSLPYSFTDAWEEAPLADARVKRPLVVISGGYLGNGAQQSWAIEALVEEGCFVVTRKHRDPGRKRASLGLKYPARAIELSELIDTALASSFLIDPSRIGTLGFSLGGMACLWLLGALIDDPMILTKSCDVAKEEIDAVKKSYKDLRVKASVLLAPAWGRAFSDQSLSSIKAPVLLIVPKTDSFVPIDPNALNLKQHLSNCRYMQLEEGTEHFIFISPLKEEAKEKISPFYLQYYIDKEGVDRKKILQSLQKQVVNFFNDLL